MRSGHRATSDRASAVVGRRLRGRMTSSGDRPGADPGSVEPGVVLYRSAHARMVRLLTADSTPVIRKTVLGPKAAERAAHEAATLTRLRTLPGIPVLLSEPDGPTLTLLDAG